MGVAAGQPGDGGLARDAGPADAGLAAADDREALAVVVEERELASEARALDKEKAEARAAEARAREERANADSQGELVIRDARVELEAVRAAQAGYRRALLDRRGALNARAKEYLVLTRRVRAGFAAPGSADFDALYRDTDRAYDELVRRGLRDAWTVLQGPAPPPSPQPQSSAIASLRERWPVQVEELAVLRRQLEQNHDELATLAGGLLEDRVTRDHEQAGELALMRAQLLSHLSPDERGRVLGLGLDLRRPIATELTHLALRLGHGVRTRLRQARGGVSTTDDWLALGELVWSVIEILLILLALRIASGRWDRWMTAIVASMGRSLQLGGGALFVARTAELARAFGPPLLVAFAALSAYALLADHRVPELDIGFVVVFTVAVARTQLRLVEALARSVGSRAAERRAQQQELDQLAAEAGDEPAAPQVAKVTRTAPADLEPVWQTLARSWRVGTRYALAVYLVLAMVAYGAERAVTHHVLSRAAWWGLVPLAVYLLHTWRRRIVFEYLARSGAREGVLGRLARRHAERFYGSVVVIPALAVLVASRTAGFVRRHLSNLDSTKRLLAWLFRRRVERHAQEHGRVLETAHELPPALHEQFPQRPLDAADRPTKPPCLAELRQLFEDWKEDGSEGSVALVGASGMGKTTILGMLEAELGEPVLHAKLISKVSDPATLFGRLARLLELDGEPTSTAEMISLLHDSERRKERRVVLVDDCHNLFLRQVGGFDAWEAFTHIVNETSDQIFWVATFNDVAWDYLNNIAARMSYFRAIIRLKGWSDTDLRHLILSRMRRSKLRPSFTDLLVTRLEGVSVSSQVIGTSHGYFRLLWDFTNGNPRDAAHFWLRSLVPEDDGRTVRVHLFAAPKVEDLQKLPDDIVFVLQAVVEHENLTANELARVTNMTLEFCRFALRYCRESGYLDRDSLTGRTRISTHWQQTVIRFLKRQHLIYS